MNIHEYRVLFVTVTCILALVTASPLLSRLLVFPQTDFFTEFWILGPNHVAYDYPYDISRNYNYSLFLGIRNRLGYCAYYTVQVKFCNQTQSAPNSFNRTSSSLPSLFNITAFVANNGIWEYPLNFSFDYAYNETIQQIEFYYLTLNDVVLDMRNYMVNWDSQRQEFFGNLFFELWIYNSTAHNFQYHERFLSLRLNMTV
jgi:uncharacterized membrane protein